MASSAWVLALALTAGAAEPLDRHLALYAQARQAESDGRFAEAEQACVQAIEAAPTGPRVVTCEARLDWLRGRKDPDGGYDGLFALQDVRANFAKVQPSVSRARVEALLTEDVAELVRVDAALWLARDSLERLDDPQRAVELTEPVVASHTGPLRKPAVGLHALALAELGRMEEAHQTEAEIRVPQQGERLTPVQQVARDRVETAVVWASVGVLGVFGAVLVPLALSARKAPMRPWGLVPIAVGTGGAWVIAEAWSLGAGTAAPWMFVGFSAVHVLVSQALREREGRVAYAVRGLGVLATLAVAMLALSATDTLQWVLP